MDLTSATVAYDWSVSVLNANASVTCLAVCEDSHFIAVGGSNGEILIVDDRTGFILCQTKAHDSAILKIKTYGNDKIICSTLDKLISVWRFSRNDANQLVCLRKFKGHTDSVEGWESGISLFFAEIYFNFFFSDFAITLGHVISGAVKIGIFDLDSEALNTNNEASLEQNLIPIQFGPKPTKIKAIDVMRIRQIFLVGLKEGIIKACC